ncbi:Poly(U) specific endoribonuclease [Trichuris trichiura]|uniref:Poly(U) specific endoribonuclease n=1 Tax=Trichuris trichiura TaxID=36087 RepID=A0A077ZIZ5_TRITR|nr:Poly(U) specific endoribonuclease [Trichuris trichiura]
MRLAAVVLCLIFVCIYFKHVHQKNQVDEPDYDEADLDFLKIRDSEIATTVKLMRHLDSSRAKKGDIVLNFQGKTDPSEEIDRAPLPLFTRVNESLLNGPTYKALADVLTIFREDVHETEHWSEEQLKKIDHFLELMMSTNPFKIAWEFIRSRDLAPRDSEHMKSLLFTIWFGLYSRAEHSLGSSGFEHVFAGEKRDSIVEGQHFWVRFYQLEKAGKINYKGYIVARPELSATIHYDWGKCKKAIGGFLVGTSPEFDFSLFTLCFLTKRGSKRCRFSLEKFPFGVTSFKIQRRPYIATTYPVSL